MKLFQKFRVDTGHIIFAFLLISCIYIWPFGFVWLDKVVIFIAFTLLIIRKELLNLKRNIQSVSLFIMIFYFLIRDMITLVNDHNLKNIKVFLVHIILLIAFTMINKINLEFTKVYIIFIMYSIFNIFNYFLFVLSGIKWEEAQGVLISGSLIFSVPFAFATILIASTSNNSDNKREMFLLLLILINGIIYQSRITLLLLFLCLGLITIKFNISIRKRIQIVSPLLILAISASFYSGTFHSVSNSELNNSQQKNIKGINNYVTDIKDSILIMIKNRESDSDRVKHLSCGFKFIKERNLKEKWFGTGANSYRYEIEKCSEFGGDDEINSDIRYIGTGSKSISLTILMVDYGLAGLVLLVVAVVMNLRYQRNNKQWYDSIITFLSIYIMSLSNINDIILIWISLVFSFGVTGIRRYELNGG